MNYESNDDVLISANLAEAKSVFAVTGADSIVSPNVTGGMRIASAMLRPHVASFLDEMLRSAHKLRVEEVVVAASPNAVCP